MRLHFGIEHFDFHILNVVLNHCEFREVQDDVRIHLVANESKDLLFRRLLPVYNSSEIL